MKTNQSSKWPVLLPVVATGLGVGAYLLVTTLAAPHSSLASRPADQLALPSPSAERAAAPVQVARAPQTAAHPEPPAAPSEKAPPAPKAKIDQEASDGEEAKKPFDGFAETVEARVERYRERQELSTRWEREQPDTKWTEQESERIQRSLQEAKLSHDQLLRVDCRETVCRFELTTAENTRGEVMSLIHVARALQEETWLRAEPQDSEPQSHVEVFLSREGYRLSGGGGLISEPPRQGAAPEGPEAVQGG